MSNRRFMNRKPRNEHRRHFLNVTKSHHKRVHPEGVRIMPEAQGAWMRDREDVKCCRFCGRWFIKLEAKKPKQSVHLDLRD